MTDAHFQEPKAPARHEDLEAVFSIPSAPRILLVEDEALISMELRDRLAQLGYVVTGSVKSGEMAIEELADSRPDLVLMDIHLDGKLDGIQTASLIRERWSVAVVFLTAYSNADLLRQAGKTHPFGYLVKPFEERELHATLQMALYRHRMECAMRDANCRLENTVRERTAELSASQARLQFLLSHSAVIVYSCRPSGDYAATFVSDNIREQLGYEPRAFLREPDFWTSRIHPDDAPRVLGSLPQLFEQGKHSHAYRFRHQNGTYRWMQDELRLIRDAAGAPVEIVGSWVDITEQKLIEEALRRSNILRREAQRIGRLGHWAMELSTGRLEWGEEVFNLFGRDPKTFRPSMDVYYREIVHPEDVAAVQSAEQAAYRDRQWHHIDHRFRRPDGTDGWAHIEGIAEYDADGKPVRMHGIVQNVTERKQIEERLKQKKSELERFNKLVVGRELQMIELKREINELLKQAGRPDKYAVAR